MNAVAALPDWSEPLAKNPGNRQRILDQEPAAFIATMERWMMAFVPKPDEYVPAQPYEELFSEGGLPSVRHLGHGSRIRDKMSAEERAIMARER